MRLLILSYLCGYFVLLKGPHWEVIDIILIPLFGVCFDRNMGINPLGDPSLVQIRKLFA